MPFTRQRHDGSHEKRVKHSKTAKRKHQHSQTDVETDVETIEQGDQTRRGARFSGRASGAVALSVTAGVLAAHSSLLAKTVTNNSKRRHLPTRKQHTEKLRGVWGWTSGSHTFIRSRPGALTPPVARVPRHTKLYVWGKFDGWYRVETPGHVFGWVHHRLLHAADDSKVKQLSHRKARFASDRTANQKVYGAVSHTRVASGAAAASAAASAAAKPTRVKEKAPRPAAAGKLASRPAVIGSAAAKQRAVKALARAAVSALTRATTIERVAAVTAIDAVKATRSPRPVARTVGRAPSIRTINGNYSRKAGPSAPVGRRRSLSVALAEPQLLAPASLENLTLLPPATTRQQPAARRRTPSRTISRASRAGAPRIPAKISAEELMRAREEFLNTRQQVESEPARQRGSLGQEISGTFQPSSFVPRGNLSARSRRAVSTRSKAVNAVRAASARRSMKAPNRGGSPRDMMRLAMAKGFGQGIADNALSYRGMPYIRGAASPSRGFDCSGLVYHVLRKRGYNPPRTSGAMGSYGKPVPRGQLQPGDLVLFANTYRRGVSHVGIYTGSGKFVHAARTGLGVRVDSLSSRYYAGKYYGARRVK